MMGGEKRLRKIEGIKGGRGANSRLHDLLLSRPVMKKSQLLEMEREIERGGEGVMLM